MKKSDINLQTYGLLVFSAPSYHMYESTLTLVATVCDSRKNNLYAGWKKKPRFIEPCFSELLLMVFTADIPQSYFLTLIENMQYIFHHVPF